MNTAVNEYNYRFKLTDYAQFDRNRARNVAIYGRVSTEHEAQLSALENQLQWYDDQVKYHPNWTVCERYIDEGITGTQAKKRPAFLKMIEDAKQGKFDLIVTREVCRFARNVVDTLVVTRELKGIGVEVFFIDDNIWTMDGDGELRLSLMATLAQEESRKTSERVKAGQKISRDNGVLYGNGNILGYDRVGDTYVINEEQAETVRMIYDLYLQGYGSMKIAKILTERKRKTASGLIKWSVSNIMRAIKNATYTGTKCYNKSRSNNFLEQKRINNLDMSTYEYVEGDFPAIISQEIWDKAQAIRESRVKPVCVSAGKNTHSKRDSRDIWVNKLRCSCGSSYRKNKWHTKLDGKTSYGYQCYNQLNNGIKRKRAEIGLDTEGYCDSRMITDWKLDFMAKALLEHLWTERKESVLIASISNSGNIVIDSLIGYWYVTAQNKRIIFKTDICIPMIMPFKGADLSLILGNLLENAVEAAEKVEENRYINVKMKFDKNNLLLFVENSYKGKLLKTRDSRLKSTKSDAENHGVGLASVYRAVAKYHGSVIIEDSEPGKFKIRIVLYSNVQE